MQSHSQPTRTPVARRSPSTPLAGPELASPADPAAAAAFWRALDRLHPGASDVLEQVSASEFAAAPYQFDLVATPQYRGAAAEGPFVRWAVVVWADAPHHAISDLRGSVLALGRTPADGAALLRADLAFFAGSGAFFRKLERFQSLATQLEAVADGAAEAALLDGVSWTMHQATRSNVARFRVLHWTPRAPAPPFVLRAGARPGQADALAAALESLVANPSLRQEALAPLGIDSFHRLPKAQYRAFDHYERIAASQGYGRLR